jgi:hypothetical protein
MRGLPARSGRVDPVPAVDLSRTARRVAGGVIARPVAGLAGIGALTGLVLLAAGGYQALAGGGPASVSSRLSSPVGAAVTVADDSVLPSDTRRSDVTSIKVVVSSTTPGEQVFVGVGRARDVDAYLGTAAQDTVSVPDDVTAGASVRLVAGDSGLPDPAGVDVWAVRLHGAGSVTLSWPRTAGSWRLVAAASGAAPELSLSYLLAPRSNPAPLLLGSGAVLLGAGVATLVALRRQRLEPLNPYTVPEPPGGSPVPPAGPDDTTRLRRAVPDAAETTQLRPVPRAGFEDDRPPGEEASP